MNTFKYSGFLDMISLIQILVGILIIIPITRLVGLLTLLPIIFNIFFMHVFLIIEWTKILKPGSY